MANINGTTGNDTLVGTESTDTINGKAGNDIIMYSNGDDTLTGGGGKDKFVSTGSNSYNQSFNTITDFGGVGKGTNPTAAVIAEVDTLIFQGDGFTARNLLLTQNGNNLEITFEGAVDIEGVENSVIVILQNFALENLDNLSKSTEATVDLGNILFDGQTSIMDSFDVFNANSTQSTIFNKNTVTFLNDLNNNVNGFDDSDDVINGQGGDDKIDGKSGDDILRGGAGNNTLIGGAGNDTLIANQGNNFLSGGDGNDYVFDSGDYREERAGSIFFGNPTSGNNTLNGGVGDDTLDANYSTGNNTLNGDAGNDSLNVDYSTGNNLLSGGAGNDYLSVSGFHNDSFGFFSRFYGTGNNTLYGGAGDDILDANYTAGNNTLNGGAGNDTLDVSYTTGTNTLNGDIGDDYLNVNNSKGNNLLFGGDGNDTFSGGTSGIDPHTLGITGKDTIDGGKGDDLLSFDYTNTTQGIITNFNATTNIGSITAGTNLVSYKNIERLDIVGTDYDDNIVGSNGNDTLSGGYGGNDTINGGKGDDVLFANAASAIEGITTTFNATTNTGSIIAGTNRVSYKNIERLDIVGTAYDDNIVGSNSNDTLSGGSAGNDTIDGGKGDDVLFVDALYNTQGKGITTNFNATTNTGSITADTNRVSYKNIERLDIVGTAYDDNIVGSDGNDTLSPGDGKDTIDGGKGDDLLSVNYVNSLEAMTSTFNATTNTGSITRGINSVSYKNIEQLNIVGTDGSDNIVGSNGNDTLSGGYSGGNDTLTGGNGTDTFTFYNYTKGVDTIYDFNATNELIQLSAYLFGSRLSIGSLSASQFTIGTSATTTEERFIYNSATGALFFDQDGSASGFTQVQFAQLSAGLSLTNNNFMVFNPD
ncbi:beta strand repeat-containing protein [Nostoc sp.]|uniref:beta strand repeat-containing protein n=1 Tax=Nostoc sp. TaxID=1180 RepID=UPI002FF510CF